MRYIKVEHNIIFNGNILPDQFSAPYCNFINICGHQLSWIWWKSLFQGYVKFVTMILSIQFLIVIALRWTFTFVDSLINEINENEYSTNIHESRVYLYFRVSIQSIDKIKHQNHANSVLRVGTSHITLPKSYPYR